MCLAWAVWRNFVQSLLSLWQTSHNAPGLPIHSECAFQSHHADPANTNITQHQKWHLGSLHCLSFHLFIFRFYLVRLIILLYILFCSLSWFSCICIGFFFVKDNKRKIKTDTTYCNVILSMHAFTNEKIFFTWYLVLTSHKKRSHYITCHNHIALYCLKSVVIKHFTWKDFTRVN